MTSFSSLNNAEEVRLAAPTAQSRPDAAAIVERHRALPDTVVDRDSFLFIAPKLGGLIGMIDSASFDDPSSDLQGAGMAEAVWDCQRGAKALDDFARTRGIDLLSQSVGFSVLKLPPDADTIEVAAVRTNLHRYGAHSAPERTVSIDVDGEQSLAELHGGGPAIIALYDLSKLKRLSGVGAEGEYTVKEGTDLSAAFLGEITLVRGGRAALALDLARHEPVQPLSDSARLKLSEFIAARIASHENALKLDAREPGFAVIRPMLEAEGQLFYAVQHAVSVGAEIPSSFEPLIRERFQLLSEEADGPWRSDSVYPGAFHPGIPNTAPQEPWGGFPAGEQGGSVADRRRWLVDRFAAELASTPHPLHALAGLVVTAQAHAKDMAIAAPRWVDLPHFRIQPRHLGSASATQAICDALTETAQAKSAGSDGLDTFRGAIPVIRDGRAARPCNLNQPAEFKVALEATLNFLEEIIHLEQDARAVEAPLADDSAEPNDGALLRSITSPLARRFFGDLEVERVRVSDVVELAELVSEVDAVARQIDLVNEYKLPLDYIKAPLFEYHLDLRWRFARWAVNEGVVPREFAPDYLFDDAALQEQLNRGR